MRIALVGVPYPELDDKVVYMDNSDGIEIDVRIIARRLAGPVDYESLVEARRFLIETGDLEASVNKEDEHDMHYFFTDLRFYVSLEIKAEDKLIHYNDVSNKCLLWNNKHRYWEFYPGAYDGSSPFVMI